MTEESKDLLIRIPPDLAERVRHFAEDHNYTIEGVVIEALDIFLREQKG